MIPVRPQDTRHKAQLLRLLTEIADNSLLSKGLFFKGGTCASMLGYLDRFSVDLDFDLDPKADVIKISEELQKIFKYLDLEVADQSQKVPEFFLKYKSLPNERNTIKLDAFGPVFKNNVYRPARLVEIDRIMVCQTIETMFANKLVALIDRLNRHKSIAGRDVYDIHHFFLGGYRYEQALITERTGLGPKKFMANLLNFVKKEVTNKQLDEDLNTLLLSEKFQKVRKTLKTETINFIQEEIARL